MIAFFLNIIAFNKIMNIFYAECSYSILFAYF